MYNVLIIAGPSASGKTTVAQKLLEKGNRFELVRSLTTREVRGDGFDSEYIYTARADFEKSIVSDGVLEYTEYAGELYGTPRSEIERISEGGKIPLLILDLNGVRSLSLRRDILNPCAVYIYCDYKTLERRLFSRYLGNGKSCEGEEKYNKRMKQNASDFLSIFEHAPAFYAFVDNSESPQGSADVLLSHFEDFLSGKERDADEINKAAEKIMRSLKTE